MEETSRFLLRPLRVFIRSTISDVRASFDPGLGREIGSVGALSSRLSWVADGEVHGFPIIECLRGGGTKEEEEVVGKARTHDVASQAERSHRIITSYHHAFTF